MKKAIVGFLGASVLFISIILIASPVWAINYDFIGGNQGWTVEFNLSPGAFAAGWQDEVNFSGTPNLGLPPVRGLDDVIPDDGAIVGSGPAGTAADPSISSFASPVFTGEAMDNLFAQYTLASLEGGNPDVPVFGQMGYQKEGSGSFFFGGFTSLDTAGIIGSPGLQPLWTGLSMAVPDGDMVTQVFVNVWVYGEPLVDGTQNWIDAVYSTNSGTDPGGDPAVPEPTTMLLFGTGLAGLIGSRIRRKK